MTQSLSGNNLAAVLRRALLHLYDPVELRHNPLASLLGQEFDDPVAGLRDLITKSIAALKPGMDVPANSNAQRYFDLLTYRFVEQMSQKEVASDMALSVRHLQRLETQALHALAESLAITYQLSLDWNEPENKQPDLPPNQVQQEIDWLKKNYPIENISVQDLINPSIETLRPFFRSQGISVRVDLPDDFPQACAQVVPLQQAILHLAGLMAESFPGGSLNLSTSKNNTTVQLTFLAQSAQQKSAIPPDELANGILLTRQVVETSGGTLATIWEDGVFSGELTLKSRHNNQVVLVVDDNQDTLLLLERYLADGPYTFVGVNQPNKTLTLLEQSLPAVIILDIMLPETDGWSLLAQVKQHPTGRDVPVIISTILPQEKLASLLGADAFLKKPFTAQQLLGVFTKLGV